MSEILEIDYATKINQDAERKRNEVKESHKQFVKNNIKKAEERVSEAEYKIKFEQAKREAEEKQTFYWESDNQRNLRYRMKQIGDRIENINNSSSFVANKEQLLEDLVKEYNELKTEYFKTPYKMGKESFKLIPTYENQNKDTRLEYENGKWNLYEFINGYWVKQIKKKVVTDTDQQPSKILSSFSNDYVKRFFPSFEIPTQTELVLLEPDEVIEQPKTNKAEPLKFSWQCDVCKTVNQYGTMKCSRCGLDRKV